MNGVSSLDATEEHVATLVKVARAYYEGGQSQQETANQFGVSRATISRMLSEAMAEGIVTITISRPFEHVADLERLLESTFNLQRAVVVPTSVDSESTMDVVARAGAELLIEVLQDGDSVGISWGRTMRHLVRELPEHPINGVTVVQMIGGLGAGDPAVDGYEIATQFAGKLHSGYRFINAPAVVGSADDCARFKATHSISDALHLAGSVDVAVYSVGTLNDPDTSLHRAGYISEAERLELISQAGVGHVLAKVITRDGREIKSFNNRVIATDLPRLHKTRWSICAASGDDKFEIALGLLQGGYANAIVVDSRLATAILRGYETEPKAALPD